MFTLKALLRLNPDCTFGRWLFAMSFMALTFTVLPWLQAQSPPCMVRCGTQQVACDQANSLLCGTFNGSVDITVQDPRTPDQPLAITKIDLALVLDDNAPNGSDWRGFVSPAQSLIFPIVNPLDPPASQQGPSVQGSSPGRTCTEAAPCTLTSQTFVTPVSGITVQRQFVLMVTQIVYQDETTQQTPRALVGQYQETIRNYTLDQFVQGVNGTFRLERSIPIAGAP